MTRKTKIKTQTAPPLRISHLSLSAKPHAPLEKSLEKILKMTLKVKSARFLGLVFLVCIAFLLHIGNHLTELCEKAETKPVKQTNGSPADKINLPFPEPPSEAELDAFIDNFVAANPAYQEDCKAYLRSPSQYNAERESFSKRRTIKSARSYGLCVPGLTCLFPRLIPVNWKWHFSQYNQDWFIFVNFLYTMTMQGRKGFYVESGANDHIRVSNTAFLDYCLGWKGICIEPLPRYHAAIREKRTCELIPNCLSMEDEQEILISNEVPGTETGTKVTCSRLDTILRQRNITNVDLWSLDVEGFEFNAMAGMDWTSTGKDAITIQALLMEQQELTQGACEQINMDYRLTTLGYHKYRIVSDAFYYKSPGGLRFPDSSQSVQDDPTSRTQLLDMFYHGLEDKRCKEQGQEVKFFTDKL